MRLAVLRQKSAVQGHHAQSSILLLDVPSAEVVVIASMCATSDSPAETCVAAHTLGWSVPTIRTVALVPTEPRLEQPQLALVFAIHLLHLLPPATLPAGKGAVGVEEPVLDAAMPIAAVVAELMVQTVLRTTGTYQTPVQHANILFVLLACQRLQSFRHRRQTFAHHWPSQRHPK